MYGFTNGWFWKVFDDLVENLNNGVTNHTPFYKKNPNSDLSTPEKIRVFRFLHNLKNAQSIDSYETSNNGKKSIR